LGLIIGRKRLAGSMIGAPEVFRQMLQAAADTGVKPWVEKRPMKEANQALRDMENIKAKNRYVLVTGGTSKLRLLVRSGICPSCEAYCCALILIMEEIRGQAVQSVSGKSFGSPLLALHFFVARDN